MGIECNSGDYNMSEFLSLDEKIYLGDFDSQKEILESTKRYNALKACIGSGINITYLRKEMNNYDKINYLDYLDSNGLSYDVKSVILDMWSKLGLKKIDIQNEKLFFKGFAFLLKLFASIESDGQNIKNNNGSSAQGYFQYLTGNGSTGYEIMVDGNYKEVSHKEYSLLKKTKNKLYKGKKITKFNIRHKKSSYELSIYKAKKYYGNNVPDWLQNNIKTPIELTKDQQTILFLIDLFTKTKRVFNRNHDLKGMRDFLPLAIEGNEWGIKKIYYVFHHTDPDNATKNRIRKKINLYRSKLIALQ